MKANKGGKLHFQIQQRTSRYVMVVATTESGYAFYTVFADSDNLRIEDGHAVLTAAKTSWDEIPRRHWFHYLGQTLPPGN